MGHLNGILAQVGGNLNNNFRKSERPGGLPGRGGGGAAGVEASILPIHNAGKVYWLKLLPILKLK